MVAYTKPQHRRKEESEQLRFDITIAYSKQILIFVMMLLHNRIFSI